jgi:hypothetical protein
MKLDYFLQEASLVKATKDFFGNELAIELKGKQDQPLPIITIFGKDFKHLSQIDKLYFPGGISDETFKTGEVSNWDDLNKQAKYKALFVFVVELKEQSPSRTLLSDITRKLNRVSEGAPVVALFKYGSKLSLATCERTTKEKGTGEKVGKISLLKDIDLRRPHAGHLRILTDLRLTTSGKKAITNFEQLYQHWRAVFNLQVLNEKFYQELFHWYLWALRLVKIPPKPQGEKLEEETLKSIFVIRLITRLMFVWFVKEKKLVEENLFDEGDLKKVLKKFNPHAEDSSVYYRAILQNLFFATLNTPLRKEAKDEHETRRFIDLAKKGSKGYSDGYTDQTLYRYEDYFSDSNKALELFDTIPFLNGGLFECLDFPENKTTGESERRYDGFSSVKEKQAFVPDVLFFGGDTELDITNDLEEESKKGKTVKRIVRVRGLAHTLKDYKFTITENTPLEEEIALDPELLGKVFENLLASYNPETKATARKQTGSFYTPREIVNYMVDESLKAYLLQRLTEGPNALVEIGRKQTQMFGNEVRKGQATIIQEVSVDEDRKKRCEEKVENLFQYAVEGNPFNEVDTTLLIRAISDCRILDPACGSGAFPMGILHRMVNVLAKLDPNNKRWKEELLRKAEEDLTTAKKMGDEVIRGKAIESAELRIQYIKDSFANNKHEFDYTRKLFLIEHCIYGVDIQQIAVQIAKLRFFISLMVDQQVDNNRLNRNILSMPNLETKFVAANSLINLDQNISGKKDKVGSGFLRSLEVEKLEDELRVLRKEIFYTRKYADKKKLKTKEAELRQRLKDSLVKSGLAETSANQMANWNPFDPIHSAGFFDGETMFGFKSGFDIVIGNPPYYQVQKLNEQTKKELEAQLFESYARTGDLYCLFYERGVKLLTRGGFLCYITSNKWMRTDYGEVMREYFTKYTRPLSLIDFGMTLVFESATTLTNVLLLTNVGKTKTIDMCRVKDDFTIDTPLDAYFKSNATNINHPGKETWVAYDKKEYKLIIRIEKQGIPLEKWSLSINYGIKTGFNEAFIIEDEDIKNKLIKEDKQSAKLLRPILRGEDIQPFIPKFNNQWLIATFPALSIKINDYPAIKKYLNTFRTKLEPKPKDFEGKWEGRKKGSYEWFETQDSISYHEDFDKPKIIYPNMTNSLPFTYDENEGYLCNDKAFILTGDHLKYLVAIFNSALFKFAFKERFPELLGDTREVRKVFFEKIPIKKPESSKQEKVFESLVDKILKKKNGNADVNTSDLERQIDLEVYHLYNLSFTEVQLIDNSVTEAEWNK